MTVAGTGHRPQKLGGFGDDIFNRLVYIVEDWLDTNPKYDIVISGMALGFDQALAIAAHNMKKKLILAIPFKGMEKVWPEKAKERYRYILSISDETIVVSKGGYNRKKLFYRNKWMVEHADAILALWSGSSGGTMACINYAKKMKVPVYNIWNDFSKRS